VAAFVDISKLLWEFEEKFAVVGHVFVGRENRTFYRRQFQVFLTNFLRRFYRKARDSIRRHPGVWNYL